MGQIVSLVILLVFVFIEVVNVLNLLGEKLFIRELVTGGDYLRPGPAISSQDIVVFVLILFLLIRLFFWV